MSRALGDWGSGRRGRSTPHNKRPDLLQYGIYIEGIEELMNLTKQLPKGYDKKYLHKILRMGAKPIINEAKKRAPVGDILDNDPHPGLLQKSIKVWPLTKSVHVGMLLGVKRGRPDTKMTTAYYASMVEYGTWKHEPQPFMRPAWDSQQAKARSIIMNNYKRKFEQEVKRLTKKGLL